MKKLFAIILSISLFSITSDVLGETLKGTSRINKPESKSKIEQNEGFSTKEKLLIASAILLNVGLAVGIVFLCMSSSKNS